MKEEKILDIPISVPSRQKKWRLTFFAIILMFLFLLLEFPFTIIITQYSQHHSIYHITFFINLFLTGLALYFFIKRVDFTTYSYGVVFIWTSCITVISNYLYSIIQMPFAALIAQMTPDFMTSERIIDFHFYQIFLEAGFLHGGFLSIGIYFLIKYKNRWLLPLIVFALWGLCYFLQIPYNLDF